MRGENKKLCFAVQKRAAERLCSSQSATTKLHLHELIRLCGREQVVDCGSEPPPPPTQACLEPMSGCGSARWSPDLHCMALVGSDDVMGGWWGRGDGGGAGLSLLQDVSLSSKL